MELNTYLGQKGYTIAKNEISIEQQKQIKTELTIKPFVMYHRVANLLFITDFHNDNPIVVISLTIAMSAFVS